MLQSFHKATIVPKEQTFLFSYNSVLNRTYLYINLQRKGEEISVDLPGYAKQAIGLMRPYGTVIADIRVHGAVPVSLQALRFTIVRQVLSYPLLALAEVVDAHLYLSYPPQRRLPFPYQPTFRKFTTLSSAEKWLNNLGSFSFEEDVISNRIL